MRLSQVLSDCVTGIDGKTVDPARVYFMMGFLFFMAASIVTLVKDGRVDLLYWGGAFGTFFTLGSAGILIKAGTEPKEK